MSRHLRTMLLSAADRRRVAYLYFTLGLSMAQIVARTAFDQRAISACIKAVKEGNHVQP